MHTLSVKKGESIFIPSGRLHAIGGGNLILEIQQNSDTTYRVYDWGRVGLDGQPRQLHIEESIKSTDFDDFEPDTLKPTGTSRILAESDVFDLRLEVLEAGETLSFPVGAPHSQRHRRRARRGRWRTTQPRPKRHSARTRKLRIHRKSQDRGPRHEQLRPLARRFEKSRNGTLANRLSPFRRRQCRLLMMIYSQRAALHGGLTPRVVPPVAERQTRALETARKTPSEKDRRVRPADSHHARHQHSADRVGQLRRDVVQVIAARGQGRQNRRIRNRTTVISKDRPIQNGRRSQHENNHLRRVSISQGPSKWKHDRDHHPHRSPARPHRKRHPRCHYKRQQRHHLERKPFAHEREQISSSCRGFRRSSSSPTPWAG